MNGFVRTIFGSRQQWLMLAIVLSVSGCTVSDKKANLDHLLSEDPSNKTVGTVSARRAAARTEMDATLALRRAQMSGLADLEAARVDASLKSSEVCRTIGAPTHGNVPYTQDSLETTRPAPRKPPQRKWTAPKFCDDRVLDTPDLMQTSESFHLPYGGETYCGPVAVTNAFLRLANNVGEQWIFAFVRHRF
jgi:hypothetical protein